MPISLALALAGALLCCPDAATPPTAVAKPLGAPTDASPVVVIDGVPYSRAEYKQFLFDQMGGGYLDVFINDRIIVQLAKKRGVQVTDELAAKWIEEKIAESKEIADLQGLDPVELRKQYAPHARTGYTIETLIRQGRADEEGLRREYELRYGEKRRARHILLRGPPPAKPDEGAAPAKPDEPDGPPDFEAAKKIADGLYADLKKGADFAKLAEKESADPGSRERGGELPEFNRLDMVPEFAEVAFKLKEDEISEPVKSQFGWHIIQVTKIIPPARALDDTLKDELRAEAAKRSVDQTELRRFIDEIRKGIGIEKRIE